MKLNRRTFVTLSTAAAVARGANLGAAEASAPLKKIPAIQGVCDPAFKGVQQAFEENFRSREELGAAVAVYKNGELVVDLWGGVADRVTGRLWERDTIVCMASVAKSMASLSVLMMVDRGQIALDKPVAAYWPEFAQAGKQDITVRTLLQGKAGVVYADAAPEGSILNWEVMVDALAKQAPAWAPGTRGGYHAMSWGFLHGELVRRVSGRPFNVFFKDEIAKPLGVDYAFGLDDEAIKRVSDLIPNAGGVASARDIADPTTKAYRAFRVQPRIPNFSNTEEFRRGVLPSGNGHGNARAIGKVYAALASGGSLDGVRLVSPELVEQIRTESWRGICALTDRDFRYGMGFFMNYKTPLLPFGPNDRAFGHPGAGGAIGLASPEEGIAFSYSPNYMCPGPGVGDRCEALIDATFAVKA